MTRAIPGASVDVVGTSLLNTSGCSVVGVLIHGTLKLLQELVNVQEIAFGPQVGKRE